MSEETKDVEAEREQLVSAILAGNWGPSLAKHPLFGEALVCAARSRCTEGFYDDALRLAALGVAEIGVVPGGQTTRERSAAQLTQASCLLLLGRLEEGLDLIEEALPAPPDKQMGCHLGGRMCPDDRSPPRTAALYELVQVVGTTFFASRGYTEVRALGGLAETYSDPEQGDTSAGPALWARFERWLQDLANARADDLYDVAEQAEQRGFTRVAEAARSVEPAPVVSERPKRDIFGFFGSGET